MRRVLAAAAFALCLASPALAQVTATLPANPVDGQRVIICSTAAITLLTVNGGTTYGGLSTLTLNGFERFIYSATLGGWVRTG